MRFVFILCSLLFFCLRTGAADAGTNLAALSRAAQDMATLDLASVIQDGDWVVAAVTPQPSRWVLRKEPQTVWDGKKPLPNNTQVLWITEGTLDVLTSLGAAPEKPHWTYRVERPGTTFGGLVGVMFAPPNTEAAALYSPFFNPTKGRVLCRIPDAISNVQDAVQKVYFGSYRNSNLPPRPRATAPRPYYLLDETVCYLDPALDFYRTNPALFSLKPEDVVVHRERLSKLLDGENPFLAAAAFRCLMRAGAWEPAAIATKIAAAERFRQALFTYSALLNLPVEKGHPFLEEMQRLSGNLKNVDQFAGIAIGADIAYDSLSHSPRLAQFVPRRPKQSDGGIATPNLLPAQITSSLDFSGPLLRTLLDRQLQLGVHSEIEKEIFFILSRFPALAPEFTRLVYKGDVAELTRLGPDK